MMGQDTNNRGLSRVKIILSLGSAFMITLFILVFLAAGIIGVYSFNNSRKVAINLSKDIQNTIQIKIKQEVDGFLSVSHTINAINAEAISSGLAKHNDLELLKKIFLNFAKSFEVLKSIAFGSSQGDFIGAGKRGEKEFDFAIADKKKNADYFVYYSNDKGDPTELVKTIKNYDPRKRGWYQSAIDAKEPTWSPIYVWASKTNIGVSAVQPVYHENGAELGVVMSALSLGFISDYLKDLKRLYSEHIYIFDRSGYLIATSSSELLIKEKSSGSDPAMERVKAEDSLNSIIRKTTAHLKKYFIDFNEIKGPYQSIIDVEKNNYYLNVTPYSDGKGLDWLIVISTPEKAIMEPLVSGTRNTVILIFMVAILAIMMGFFLVRFIVRPIAKLNQDIKNRKSGEWKPLQNISHFKEVNQLTLSYNNMLDELKFSFETLEKKVAYRTTQLSKTNLELRNEIIERKQAEEDRIESTEKLHLVINTSPIGICTVDSLGNFITTNQAYEQMLGYSKEELKELSFFDVTHPDYRPKNKELFQNMFSLNSPGFKMEKVYSRKDGRSINVSVNARTVKGHGNIKFGTAFVEDITERKKAVEEKLKLEGRLQQAQKMESIGTLAGGIAHDFNNLLSVILGFTEMAKDDCQPGTPIFKDLDEVLGAGNRAKGLVQQILAFSRQDDIKRMVLQPASIVEEAITMLRPSLPTTIGITQDIDAVTGFVFVDPTQLNQILMNLCTNAFHAMEDTGGRLDISLKEVTLTNEDLVHEPDVTAGSFIQLSIADSGTGIAPTVKDKIFDPYFTTKETGKGTGMGLSVVHGIVKNYGGFISLYSEFGEGTVFHVFLPIVEKEAPTENEINGQAPTGRERVLFVDDEVILTQMGKAMLERLGYHVTARNSSLEALETFQNQPDKFDLVITDQTMPGMTGSDLSRRMLQIRPDIPIILCTGYSTIISEDKAKLMGIKEFAFKPLAKKDIAKLIRKVLDVS